MVRRLGFAPKPCLSQRQMLLLHHNLIKIGRGGNRTDDGGGLGNSTLDSAVQVQRFSTKLIPRKVCKSFCPKNLQRPELCSSFVMTHDDPRCITKPFEQSWRGIHRALSKLNDYWPGGLLESLPATEHYLG